MVLLLATKKLRITTSPRDTGLRYNSGIYSSQLIANYQRLKNYNYTNNLGRYAGDATPMTWNSVIFSGVIALR